MNKFHTLYFEATRNCNFNCENCSTGSSKYKKFIDVPYDKILNRVLLPAWDLGTRFVDFSGGEFLCRPDHIKILKIANDIGFRISVVSNGSLLTDEKIEKIKSVTGDNLLITLGINSFDEENKDSRNVGIEKTLDVIERLNKHSVSINIAVTIGDYNKSSFGETVEKIREMHLPFNRTPFVPRNCNAHDLMLNSEILKNYFHPYLRKYYNGQISYTPFMLPPNVYENITGQKPVDGQYPLSPSVGCWVGSYYSINPEGEVSPCPLFGDQVTGGNVYKQNLKEILFESDLFVKITDRKNLEGKCGNCKYNFTCGGCRVMAYYVTGNALAGDPVCFLDQLDDNEIVEIENETIKSFKNYYRLSKIGKLI